METEYGSLSPVRFGSAVMRDGDGNVMLCKCGKPAGGGAIAKESYIVWCGDCGPYAGIETEKLVYTLPESTQLSASVKSNPILQAAWTIDMKDREPVEACERAPLAGGD